MLTLALLGLVDFCSIYLSKESGVDRDAETIAKISIRSRNEILAFLYKVKLLNQNRTVSFDELASQKYSGL